MTTAVWQQRTLSRPPHQLPPIIRRVCCTSDPSYIMHSLSLTAMVIYARGWSGPSPAVCFTGTAGAAERQSTKKIVQQRRLPACCPVDGEQAPFSLRSSSYIFIYMHRKRERGRQVNVVAGCGYRCLRAHLSLSCSLGVGDRGGDQAVTRGVQPPRESWMFFHFEMPHTNQTHTRGNQFTQSSSQKPWTLQSAWRS